MLTVFTQIGSPTSILQAAASVIGAGAVLGAFLAGAVGVARGWSREEIEWRALRSGYLGGIVAAALLIVDSATRCLA